MTQEEVKKFSARMLKRGHVIDSAIKANDKASRAIAHMVLDVYSRMDNGSADPTTVYTFLLAGITSLEELGIISLKNQEQK